MTVGERIKDFRVKNLMTIREAASLFGVSIGEINRLERGRNKPHFITEAKWDKLIENARNKGYL